MVLKVCEEQCKEANEIFKACDAGRGDRIVQEMEEADIKNPSSCHVAMFKILRRACVVKDGGEQR